MMRLVHLKACFVLLCFVANLSFADQARTVLKPAAPASPVQAVPQTAQSMPAFPVRFADTEIFVVSTSPLATLTPENRARLIQQNIQAYADSTAATKLLRVIARPEGLGIGNDDGLLMIITDRDAEKTGKTATELAAEVLARVQSAVDSYRTRHTWKTYGLGAAYTILAIIGLWLALHWNNKAFAWLAKKLASMESSWKKDVRIKNIKVFSARRIERAMLLSLGSIRVFIILLCWYLFLLLTLSFFPETRKLGARIFDYLLKPFASIFHAIVGYIPNLFYILVIVLIAFYALKLISYVFRLIEHGELKFDWFYEDWARPTYQIIRFLVIVTALISAYPYIPGSSSKAFQGVSLMLGAIISFASSSAISNIVAGIILTYTRAFKLNDRIQVGESIGDVVEKTLLVTRINTIKEVVVTIPNSLVMGSQIINYSTSAAEGEGVILHTSVTIGYGVPWQQVQALLIEAALATEHVLQHPAPFVLQTALNDYYVSHEINVYTREPELMANIYSDLHRNILDKFDAAGVEIMSPHYYALRDGNASVVPSVLSAKDYQQPAFRFDSGAAAD